MKELKRIKTDKIADSDRRFIYRPHLDRNERGNPAELPLLWDAGDTFIPVRVFQYQLSEKEIDALVYTAETDYETILKELVEGDEPGYFDRAAIIGLLESYGETVDKKSWSRLLKINPGKWRELRSLSEYESEWQIFLEEKKAPLKRILSFSDGELRRVLGGLLEMNPGINMLESIAVLLVEIAGRDHMPLDAVWQGISEVNGDDDEPAAQKLRRIREKLTELRYPTISEYRNALNDHLKDITRPEGTTLLCDDNFETPGMRLQADIREKQDIEILRTWLNDQEKNLKKILDIQRGQNDNE